MMKIPDGIISSPTEDYIRNLMMEYHGCSIPVHSTVLVNRLNELIDREVGPKHNLEFQKLCTPHLKWVRMSGKDEWYGTKEVGFGCYAGTNSRFKTMHIGYGIDSFEEDGIQYASEEYPIGTDIEYLKFVAEIKMYAFLIECIENICRCRTAKIYEGVPERYKKWHLTGE